MYRNTMRKVFYLLEKSFTISSLIIYSGGFLSLARSGGASEGDSGFLSQSDSSLILIVFQLIYVITFFLLLLRWKKTLYSIQNGKLVTLSIGIAVASVLWSFDPKMTLIRCVALIGTSLFGLYIATRYTFKEQMSIFAWTFGLVIVFSFATALILPKYGIMGGIHAGAWRGIYNHKNVLGKMMVLSSFIFLVQDVNRKKRLLNSLGLGASIILLVCAKSSSAISGFVILLAIFVVLKTLRWRYEVMIPALLAILMVGVSGLLLVTQNMDVLFTAAGKDPTLTGRTDLWSWVLDSIWKHPWLGYGYGAFWQESNSEAVLVRYAAGWDVPNAHNGLLDLWVDLGILGTIILLLSIFNTLMKSFSILRKTENIIYIWPLLFLFNMSLANLTESTLMVRNDVFWVIYVALAFSALVPDEKDIKKRLIDEAKIV